MPIPVEMPKMTDTMEEGVLVQWLVAEGGHIAAGDVIAQVETDKATMDVEAYDDGVLIKRVAGEGDALPIGGLIAILGEAGEDVSELLAQYSGDSGTLVATDEPPVEEAVAASEPVPVSTEPQPGGRPKASPLAKRMAADHGLTLARLVGSGPEGRIIKRDIEAELQRAPAPMPVPAAGARGHSSTRISPMRKSIARRLADSKYTAPHFYLNVDVDMARCVAAREDLNALAERRGETRVSFNDWVTKACAAALRDHPAINVSYLPDEGVIRQYDYVDVGVAVAIEDGLVTPVVRDADLKSILEIAAETRALSLRARERKLTTDEMAGSTFTTSNLGMFGIESFTAIINPPNSCILAIGAVREVPVVEKGHVVIGQRMTLTLSCDHRAVDGATGARFLGTVRDYLESPLTLFL